MRFVRVIAGIVLLTIGLPALLVGGVLWAFLQHRNPDGAFGAALERVETGGQAIVVPDLDAMLRRAAPFTRFDRSRLRLTAQTPDGPAFLGIGPAAEVANYLRPASRATVDRVNLANGPLPVRISQVIPAQDAALPPADRLPGPTTEPAVAAPRQQSFWVRQGLGGFDLAAEDVRGQPLSLVIMRPDAQGEITVDLRAEVRSGWLDPARWGLLAGGLVFVMLGGAILVWPVRPREVVFVVEPGQVPVLAARVGLSSLSDLGQPDPGYHDARLAPDWPEAEPAAAWRVEETVLPRVEEMTVPRVEETVMPRVEEMTVPRVEETVMPRGGAGPAAGARGETVSAGVSAGATAAAAVPGSAGAMTAGLSRPLFDPPPVGLTLTWPPPSPMAATPVPSPVVPAADTPAEGKPEKAGGPETASCRCLHPSGEQSAIRPVGGLDAPTDPSMPGTNLVSERDADLAWRRNEAKQANPIP